jgi:hypothetical protein
MKPKPSIVKRERERTRLARRQQKDARRAEASARKAAAPNSAGGGEDPDLAGIQLGPQPAPDWLQD